MSEPRISKRESSSALRRETLASAGRKRSGSNASVTSRASAMFSSPAKGFGLVRKASTATLSVAPVSVSGGGIDHKLEGVEGKAGGVADKVRPVRQATRAEDALRFVQARAPVPAPEPELAPLSESPKADPAPLPADVPPAPAPAPSTSPSRIPRPKSRASLIPVFRGSPERSKTTATPTPTPSSSTMNKSPPRASTPSRQATSSTNKTPPLSSTPPRQTTSKFRAPTMTPGLTRKASTSSIRSTATTHKPISSSPLATKTTPTPALPKLDTASVSVPPKPVVPEVTNSPSGTSWLSSIRGITSSKSAVPGSGSGLGDQPKAAVLISESPIAEEVDKKSSAVDGKVPSVGGKSPVVDGKVNGKSPVMDRKSGGLEVPPTVTAKSSKSTLRVSPTQADYATAPASPVSPVDSESQLVLVDTPTTPIEAPNSNTTYTINSLAAQHASNMIYGPASWLGWMTSPAPAPTSTTKENVNGEVMDVMEIASDEEDYGRTSEDYGRTPDAVVGSYEGQKAGWGWSAMGMGRASGESARPRASGESTRDKGKAVDKRPPMHATALSVDSVVPPVAESYGEDVPAPPALTIKPVTQNALNLNATALRYALQLPLLGRSKAQVADSPGGISERSSPLVNESQASNRTPGDNGDGHANPGMIVTRYSDDHDFVIIEIEVDGWILIDTEGTLPDTPLQAPSATRQFGTGGNAWWDYYIGRTSHGPAAPDRVDTTGPAAVIAEGLSSPARSTEVARDADSVNSSLLTNVLRPFGRGKDVKAQTDGSAATTTAQDTQESSDPPKTQAELIKEEALARQSPSVVPGLPSPVLNTATRSSWVSYFSSKASRSAPAMTDGRAIKQRAENAGEMEVMDIDEEDLSEPIEVHTSNPDNATSATPTRTTPVNAKPASPLTDSPSVKRKASVISQGKQSSASSSRSAKVSLPNYVLPTFGDTFYTVPRCMPPRAPNPVTGAPAPGSWKLKRTVKNISTMLFNTTEKASGPNVSNAEMEEYQRQAAERHRLTNRANFAVVEPAVPRSRTGHPRPGSNRSNSSFGSLAIDDFGQQLPRVFSVLNEGNALGDIAGPIRAVVIGVHGWFPGPLVRSVFGEPTGTSVKFATMGVDAVRQFAEKHGLNLESVTPMPLEGEGTIERRVTKLYDDLLKHPQWLADLHRADVVLVATHSQGSIVSTHLIARLISDGHIRTKSNRQAVNHATEQTGVLPPIAPHRVCCLAMCGIHMGPLYSLNSSSLAQPYLQWFESQAARELFEFQDTESEVSRNYVAALSTALDHGTKFVYIASLNDQVVPIYSGTFVAASHPLILRGLFLDGDAYSSSDFLSNLLVLLLRVKNAGLDEHGLVVHLSEATAGSLSGIGHSTAYEDAGPYTLAVRYMFETSDLAPENDCKLSVDAFQARASRNDYEIPWLLHSVISDARISRIFSAELAYMRDSFADWKPTTAVLRDIQRKLAPIRVSPLRHSMVPPAPQEPVNSKL